MKKSVDVTYSQSGFTLIELMIALVVMAIIAAIAYPNYTQYMERRDLAIARQEALRIAAELERFKAKNFSYKGFDASYVYAYQEDNGSGTMVAKSYYDPATGKLNLPVGATGTAVKYTITLVDGGSGYKPLTIAKNNDGTETSDSASVKGLTWAMSVERAKEGGEPKQPRNFDLLLTNLGIRCMTKTKNTVTGYTGCGSEGKSW